MSQTAYRTYHATEVTEQLIGEEVTLAGWVDRRRDHGGGGGRRPLAPLPGTR